MIGLTLIAGAVFMGSNYYPPEALRNNEQGVSVLRIEADVAGHPDICTVSRSSGSPRLDEAACQLVERQVTYPPQVDAVGMPTRSSHEQRVRWKILDDAETSRELPAITLALALLLASLLIAMPMSLINALEQGRFSSIEHRLKLVPAGRVDRSAYPMAFWTLIAARLLAILILAAGMTTIVGQPSAQQGIARLGG